MMTVLIDNLILILIKLSKIALIMIVFHFIVIIILYNPLIWSWACTVTLHSHRLTTFGCCLCTISFQDIRWIVLIIIQIFWIIIIIIFWINVGLVHLIFLYWLCVFIGLIHHLSIVWLTLFMMLTMILTLLFFLCFFSRFVFSRFIFWWFIFLFFLFLSNWCWRRRWLATFKQLELWLRYDLVIFSQRLLQMIAILKMILMKLVI